MPLAQGGFLRQWGVFHGPFEDRAVWDFFDEVAVGLY